MGQAADAAMQVVSEVLYMTHCSEVFERILELAQHEVCIATPVEALHEHRYLCAEREGHTSMLRAWQQATWQTAAVPSCIKVIVGACGKVIVTCYIPVDGVLV